jgi:hypothetical protein
MFDINPVTFQIEDCWKTRAKHGRFVLTRVAKNISAFGDMTPCILVDGTGVSQEIAVRSLTTPSGMLQ